VTPPRAPFKRVVLDTNVIVSALLFRGPMARLHELWKQRALTILASREIIEEYVSVLAYPKFDLTEGEIGNLLQEELIPYIEPVKIPSALKSSRSADPDDEKFLLCAEAAQADAIVSGDAHLLRLKKVKRCPIVRPEKFLSQFR